jgi:PAS domain S-box-containing protein
MASSKRPVVLDASRSRSESQGRRGAEGESSGLLEFSNRPARVASHSKPVIADQAMLSGLNEGINSIKLEGPGSAERDESLKLLFQSADIIPWSGPAGALQFDKLGLETSEFLGYPLERWYEDGFWASRVHPGDLQRVISFCQRISEEHGNHEIEYRLSAIDGRIVWVRQLAIAGGEKALLQGYIIDVSDFKQAAGSLKEQERRLSIIDQSVKDGLCLVNVEAAANAYEIASVNGAFLSITGFTRQQVIGRPVAEILTGRAGSHALSRFGKAIRQNKPERWEAVVEFPAGERFCEMVATPVLDELQDRQYLVTAIHDVTATKRNDVELKKSWELSRSVLESLRNPAAVLDSRGTITAVNDAWVEHRKNASPSPPRGMAEGVNYLQVCERAASLGSSSSRDALEGIRSVMDGSREYFEMEYLCSDAKGGSNWFRMVVTPLRRTGGAVVSHRDITERKLAEQRVRDLSGRLIHGQEEERRRIARELHDDVNQRLALLAIELEQFAREAPESSDEIRQRARDLCGLAQSISSDVHRMSHKLHPSKLDHLGLVEAARDFCMGVSQHHGIHVDFFHRDVPDRIPSEISLCIFRIIQESLQNVVKHSGAKQAYVGLVGHSDEIRLEISDPGAGFDVESDKGKAGLGLVSMRERVRFAGGEMWIRSRRSHGTRIDVKMPLRAPALKKTPMTILIDN